MKAVVGLCCSVVVVLLLSSLALSQSLTTGAINGTILDSSGAAISGATIVATNTKTGAQRTTTSGGTGLFVLAQLDPGDYTLTVQAQGFKTGRSDVVTVSVSRVASFHFRLQVGATAEKVEVTSQAALIEPSNPNTTTTFSSTQLADLPNPGNDLSYFANLAPGAIMNVASSAGNIGQGNTAFNGLGSVATDFSIDGIDANSVAVNTNLTGASGLQLGLNAVEEVSINTEAYSVEQGGRLGAAAINYITRSGTNAYHGNAWEVWNGSSLNAQNYFLNARGVPQPRSNVNQFGASVGGPIVKGKVFFFADLEGVRLVLPTPLSSVLPSPLYQAYVLQQLPLGGIDTATGGPLPAQPAEVPFYQNMFKLMGDTSRGIPLGLLGCPFDTGGGPPANPGAGDGCANNRLFSASPLTSETLFTIKLDYNRNANNSYWFRFQFNNGSHSSPDPVSSIFDTVRTVPIRSGAASWTHVFTPKLVNQLNPGLTYSFPLLKTADAIQAQQSFPIVYLSAAGFSSIGGSQEATPNGNAVTVWQLNDNVNWIRGNHNAHFGVSLRRVLFNAFNSSLAVPLEIGASLAEFTYGAAAYSYQSFYKREEDQIKSANLDLFAGDTHKATDKLTVTVGMRVAVTPDFVSKGKVFSTLRMPFEKLVHDVDRPLNQDILSNQAELFPDRQLLQWQPRAALAYELSRNTVLRGGFGVFGYAPASTLPSEVTLQNAPAVTSFVAGLFGTVGGVAVAPGVPTSVVGAAAAANQQFQAGFAGGALSCASTLSTPSSCLPPTTFNYFSNNQSGREVYPYSLQWSSSMQHQFGSNLAVTLKYVGTKSVKGNYQDLPNAYQTACAGCFAPLPFNVSPDPRFGSVFGLHAGANSSYNGLQVTGEKRMSHGLTVQGTYSYSHCLDFASNGGISQFNANPNIGILPGQLPDLYGNCDYDIRHSLNGFYLYELPLHSANHWLNGAIGGWQVSGTFFLHGGLPFSVSSPAPSSVVNGSPILFANAVAGQKQYTQTSIAGVTQPATLQWLNPSAFQSVFDNSTFSCFPVNAPQNCKDGNLRRNSLRAPGFRWMDFSVGKKFRISENVSFRFDTQFFNLFNHPNFDLPASSAGIPTEPGTLVGFGGISNTVAPVTGLLGSRLGGDSSVRMVAFRGQIQF